MTALSVLLVSVAVYRLTRLVGVDEFPFGAARSRLRAIVDDAHDDEQNGCDATRSQRAAAWLYEGATCPWCASVWLSVPACVVWQQATHADPWWFWAPCVALAASAFTGVATYVVSLLGGLAEKHGE